MIKNLPVEEDIALKRFSSIPNDQKPRFNWKEVFHGPDTESSEVATQINIKTEDGVRAFDIAEIADTIGNALTNLLLSREVNDIFNEKNRQFVANVSRAVSERLNERTSRDGEFYPSARDIDLLIERALIEHHAHDVAKSLVVGRQQRTGGESDALQTVRVIRRNGQLVPWDSSKIEVAVRKAFLSLEKDSDPASLIADAVAERVENKAVDKIYIEEVQDFVQEELMRQGHFKVAESYILYRSHRASLREAQEIEEDDRQDAMVVVNRADGSTFFWDGNDLKKRIDYALIGLEIDMSKEEIETELRRSLHAEMSEEDLKKTVLLNSKTLIERDADFAKFAGRILETYIYEEVLDWSIEQDGVSSLKTIHRDQFRSYLKKGVALDRLSERMLNYDLDKLADALDPVSDMDFDYLGIQTLFDRYLIVDKTHADQHVRIETPQYFWMRVAMGLFLGEHEKSPQEDRVIELYNLYKSRRFCSSTPTLFNSGTKRSQLSSCYLYKVDDSIESIMFRGIAENAFLSKWAGGLGGSWTAVRGTGSHIAGTNGESQGVIPFLKLHNDQLVAVNQGGKRRGSGCAYLETWHNDIYDFLELRRNTGDDRRRTHDMNTANWIPDLFMKRMEAREEWTLFHSNEVPDLHDLSGRAFEEKYVEYERAFDEGKISGQRIKAIDLWKKMLQMIFETGHPWITFKDPCNIRSPQDHVGVIHSSNLCTEITLNTSDDETAVCNLGSVVLDSHIKEDGSLDLEKMRETIRIAVRALDNVIDINFYPTEAARTSNLRHRPIGLGVMGLQNALYMKGIPFSSDEAVEFSDEFQEAIAFYAYEASSDLAAEKGAYSSFKGSKWDRGLLPQDTAELLEKERGIELDIPSGGKMDWEPLRSKIQKQGMRNSNVLAIAPTATISNIMGSSPCIEPTYKNLFVKSNLSGEFIVLNAYLVRELKQAGLWTREVRDALKYFDGELDDIHAIPESIKTRYKTAFGVDYRFIVESAARRQKWIDQSQSVNLFLKDPDLKTLSHMYRAAWRMGLKTTYYLRTLGASNIEKATVTLKQTEQKPDPKPAQQFTAEEKAACSLDAMMNGGECEACQ
jgi:ribonucleoside-diphosphate reductase alpha chain